MLQPILCIFTEFIGATEFPSDTDPYLNVTGNPGCYNDTDLPTKPTINSKQNRTDSLKLNDAVFMQL